MEIREKIEAITDEAWNDLISMHKGGEREMSTKKTKRFLLVHVNALDEYPSRNEAIASGKSHDSDFYVLEVTEIIKFTKECVWTPRLV